MDNNQFYTAMWACLAIVVIVISVSLTYYGINASEYDMCTQRCGLEDLQDGFFVQCIESCEEVSRRNSCDGVVG